MDESIREALVSRLERGQLPCARAFAIARAQKLSPREVGDTANAAGIRISRCQLGLFGYGPKAEGKHKIVRPLAEVPEAMAVQLRAAADGTEISCAALWAVAEELRIDRLRASAAAEALGLHVSVCQLGCFPRPG